MNRAEDRDGLPVGMYLAHQKEIERERSRTLIHWISRTGGRTSTNMSKTNVGTQLRVALFHKHGQ